MGSYPVSAAQARLEEMIGEAITTDHPVTLTRDGEPVAVLLAVEHYESLVETLAVLSDPRALPEIRQAERDIAAGRGHTVAEVRAALAARRAHRTDR